MKPRLVVEVAFTDWTDANHLRHALIVAIRDDKSAREVVREGPPARAKQQRGRMRQKAN